MMAELHDALVKLDELDGVKAVIFMSDDPSFFCSGGDHDSVRTFLNPEGGYKMATLMHDVLLRLAFSDFLTVTLVRGRAIGGGAELTTATDLPNWYCFALFANYSAASLLKYNFVACLAHMAS